MGKVFSAIFLSFIVILTGCSTNSQIKDLSASDLLEADVDTLIALAREAEKKQHYSNAINHYESALSQDDSLEGIRAKLAALYCKTGDFTRCQKVYQAIVSKHPNNISAAEGAAFATLKLGNIESAKEQYLNILEINPDSFQSLNYLGVISDLAGDYGESAKYYDLALLLRPDDQSILNNLGYSYLMSGRYDDAQAVLEKALANSDRKPVARIKNNLSICYARQGMYSKAVELISPTMDDPVVYNNVGYIAMLNGDYNLAVRYFEKAITLSPQYYERADVNLKRTRQLILKEKAKVSSHSG